MIILYIIGGAFAFLVVLFVAMMAFMMLELILPEEAFEAIKRKITRTIARIIDE